MPVYPDFFFNPRHILCKQCKKWSFHSLYIYNINMFNKRSMKPEITFYLKFVLVKGEGPVSCLNLFLILLICSLNYVQNETTLKISLGRTKILHEKSMKIWSFIRWSKLNLGKKIPFNFLLNKFIKETVKIFTRIYI